MNYDSGDDSPLVIDESAVDTSLKTLLSDFSGNEPKVMFIYTSFNWIFCSLFNLLM